MQFSSNLLHFFSAKLKFVTFGKNAVYYQH